MDTSTSVLPYYFCFIVPAVVASELLGALPAFASIAFVFGLVPLVDLFVGIDIKNLTEKEEDAIKKDPRFTTPLVLFGALQLMLQALGAFLSTRPGVGALQYAGAAVAVGIMGGLSINIAHELTHRPSGPAKRFGKLLLTSVGYGAWWIEHVYGHHKNVATPSDPASARYGESFYAFYPRTVVGSFKSAWSFEAARLARRSVPTWSTQNQVLQMSAGTLAFLALYAATLGRSGAVFFTVQAWVAFSLLELINFIEHWGLERKQGADGKFEPVNRCHSWNAPQRITNLLLFKLQRHSDHHENASRHYQVLRSFPESPQLPTGYAGMCVLALVPPLFNAIMGPRARSYEPVAVSRTK